MPDDWLYRFAAIDRTSKFAVARLYDEATRRTSVQVLEEVLIVVPYKLHTILTDNGIQFAEQPRNRNTIYSRVPRDDGHLFHGMMGTCSTG